ncbi:MAG TPA: hypothetical protein VHM30_15965 [Gemmatimonadaceae bacterium]|nr:hypothetical protein [Gemmatimonadaceae bacterium]
MIGGARLLRGAIAIAFAAAASSALSARAGAQTVQIRDLGPGRAGRWLRDALRAPHVLLRSDSANPIALPRDTTYGATVIIIGGPATVASRVLGDVIVVGGDLFLHPGVEITGRAVAIGGGVYETTLGHVGGGVYSSREYTYVATSLPDGTIVLDYQPLEVRDVRVVTLPGFFGVRIPTYDRSDGLSFPVGPTFSFDTARIEVDALITYRSQLGEVDPSLTTRASIGRRLTIDATAGRETMSNDRWIYGDIPNSLMTLATGTDTRNYYRADRAEGRLSYRFEGATSTFTIGLGALGERARSVRPDTGARGGPWSLFGRRRVEHMLRPNPRVIAGTIASSLGAARLEWADQGVSATASAFVEVPWEAPGDRRFVQTTLDGTVAFPTFGVQSVELESHAVLTAGDTAPPQRYAYLGGTGTLPTFELLEFGGDQLFFLEGRYIIPLEHVQIRFLGTPTVTLRYITGGARVARFPTLEQNVGARLAISLLRIDFLVDPASRETRFSAGISLFR